MQCRDAQFYLRLRRHAGDELGADVTVEIDRHLAGCPACAADAHCTEAFDRAVTAVMRTVPVPPGLRDKLLAQATAHHGTAIRRKVYRGAALAASIFFAAGLVFGLFSASRPKIDTYALVEQGDELIQNPDLALSRWLTEQKFPDQLPKPFDNDLLVFLGTERVQGKDVPVAVFRHPTERGFAKVYLFRTNGPYNLKDLVEAQASHTMALVIDEQTRFRGVTYVILHTHHPVGPGEDPLKPFLRAGRSG